MRWHRHHHFHGPPPHCATPDERRRFYLRWRLQRKIFAWFGLTILITALVAGFVGRSNSVNMKTELLRGEALLVDRFALVWDDPSARDELGRSVAKNLDVELSLTDANGRTVGEYGGSKCVAPIHSSAVSRGGQSLGTVSICAERYRMSTMRILGPLALAFLLLWAGSHAIARRLARPFAELERVASEIGKGNLKARFQTERRRHGGDDALAVGGAINDMAERIEKQLAD